MYQPLVAFFGLVGLLFLVLLGGEMSTDLDFSLRRVHTAPNSDEVGATAARSGGLPLMDPRCARP